MGDLTRKLSSDDSLGRGSRVAKLAPVAELFFYEKFSGFGFDPGGGASGMVGGARDLAAGAPGEKVRVHQRPRHPGASCSV